MQQSAYKLRRARDKKRRNGGRIRRGREALLADLLLPHGIRRTVQTQNKLEAGHMISVCHVSTPAFQSRYSASRRLGARDGRQALACQQQWFHFLAQRAATIQFRQPVAAYAVWEACGHHHQMEYAMPAIRRALTITVAMPAVSRMESCQSCFGSNAMLHHPTEGAALHAYLRLHPA